MVDYRLTGSTFSIGHARDVLSDDVSSNILFAHAIVGSVWSWERSISASGSRK